MKLLVLVIFILLCTYSNAKIGAFWEFRKEWSSKENVRLV